MITTHAAPARSAAAGGPAICTALGTAGTLCLLVVTVMSGWTAPTVPARDALPVGGASTAAGGPATRLTSLGPVVTAGGFTLYRYAKDTADPSRSACTGGCATTWPPLLDAGIPALGDLPRNRVGTVRRPDGTRQVTLDGWPLYRYAKDGRPGDTKGEGVGGSWRAVGPDGRPASVAARTPADALASAAVRTPAPGAEAAAAVRASTAPDY